MMSKLPTVFPTRTTTALQHKMSMLFNGMMYGSHRPSSIPLANLVPTPTVGLPDQGQALVIHVLKSLKLMRFLEFPFPCPEELEVNASFLNISTPPSRVALPELLAPKLLQWCSTPDTFQFNFTAFAQLFGTCEFLTSRC